jgi:hypothetical protein
MGLDSKSRRTKLLAGAIHGELSAAKFGRLLYLRDPDKYDRLFIAHGLYPSREDAEHYIGRLMADLFKSIGICIKNDVEIKIGKGKLRTKPLFTIKYGERERKKQRDDLYANRRTNIEIA